MVVNLLEIEIGHMEVKGRSETDMWNNLRVLLVANNVQCRIVDSYKSQYCQCECICRSMIWLTRTPRQGFGYFGYSFAYGGRIFWRKFRNSRTMDFRYDERVPRAKW
jgi:hypothetical protein